MKYGKVISSGAFIGALKDDLSRFGGILSQRFSRIAVGSIAAVLVAGVLGLINVASAANGQAAGHVAPTPAGFVKFLVYMAEPTLAPGEPSQLTDSANIRIFQQTIMGRSEAQLAQDRANAEQFFLQRFGLDFSAPQADPTAPESIPGATLRGYFLNPKVNYTAYVISGEAVPSQGWVVRDGGWIVTLDQDMALGGMYGGAARKPTPAGALLLWGDYNIKADRPNVNAPPHRDQTIVIHYQSDTPVVLGRDDTMPFICDLIHPEWGIGKVRGVVFPASQTVIRNVLTFPPSLQ